MALYIALIVTFDACTQVKDAGKLSSGEVIVAALSGITSREEALTLPHAGALIQP